MKSKSKLIKKSKTLFELNLFSPQPIKSKKEHSRSHSACTSLRTALKAINALHSKLLCQK